MPSSSRRLQSFIYQYDNKAHLLPRRKPTLMRFSDISVSKTKTDFVVYSKNLQIVQAIG